VTLTAAQLSGAADQLRSAESERRPVAPLSGQFAGLTVADAYAIQLANIAARLSAGAVVKGHKVGLTARAMQELLGVDEPDFGHILDDMVFENGAKVPFGLFCQPRVEPEITFLLRQALRGPGITADDVRAATDAVAPSIEIVDSRIADWRITLPDTIADNASAAATVLSGWVPIGSAPALPGVAVELLVNGDVVSTGAGDAVLGDPALAVAWLANALAAFDVTIEAGHLVMPGSCTSAPLVAPGDRVEARFAGLGHVSVTFT
jgi:2-keto-4-pentenoate hydratase